MKKYRIYGEYVQRVWIEVVAEDHEVAQDIAADLPPTEWTTISATPIDITEVE
jgi:muconolactone delta-isomerase